MSANGFDAAMRTTGVVYGEETPGPGDAAETYHEASKAYPAITGRAPRGAQLLKARLEVRAVATRSTKRHAHRPAVQLPPPALPAITLAAAVGRRRSQRVFAGGGIALAELATLLHTAYGVTSDPDGASSPALRTVPSGGALYPLDLYAVVRDAVSLDTGLYHYDPLRHVLEHLAPLDERRLEQAMIFRELLDGCSVLFLISATFWRTRFKYGLRGFRFALIEVGHLAQNLLLACAALDLPAVPLGGFFDRRIDELLALDGVNESTLYGVCVGGRPPESR